MGHHPPVPQHVEQYILTPKESVSAKEEALPSSDGAGGLRARRDAVRQGSGRAGLKCKREAAGGTVLRDSREVGIQHINQQSSLQYTGEAGHPIGSTDATGLGRQPGADPRATFDRNDGAAHKEASPVASPNRSVVPSLKLRAGYTDATSSANSPEKPTADR
ncbi:hypothetical protein EPUS_04819 [Endocarpon pusillum Z07020]|uniref:Uncharacterized protein n=1 Tax=Endocarpon pusillum (strain Z07020 / HMAS-L-300199) TaxID=1263415 RepID=U1GBU9_ENDPU|nr:uncharacterized protein EPUS_04819 [Endocarpon pusillum Z07020]ERF75037.1 hypothetical protein EPUS_04819 [Endocarpon pusillum Z07020]